MVIFKTLPNIGYLIGDVPEYLFNSLKMECEVANKARYDSSIEIEVLKSGITAKGVAQHYFVKKNKIMLSKFILDYAKEYYNEYPEYFKKNVEIFSNKNIPLIVKSWINIQEKTEYIPNHMHHGILSYVIWIRIPYDINDEIVGKNGSTSKFQFCYNNILGNSMHVSLPLDSSYQGKIMMFPSLLTHCVYPFYSTDENRISISGNVLYDTSKYA